MNHDSLLEVVYRATQKTRARRDALRRDLLDAARALVAEGGFANASVHAVATRANLATGTVYRHFPSKAQLFVELFREASGREVEAMARAGREHESATQALEAAIRTWASRALDGRTLAYALIAEPVMPEVETARLEFRRAYTDVLRGILRHGSERGEFSVADAEVAAAAIVGALAEALVGPLSRTTVMTQQSRAALISNLVQFCTQAVTPSGHAVTPLAEERSKEPR